MRITRSRCYLIGFGGGKKGADWRNVGAMSLSCKKHVSISYIQTLPLASLKGLSCPLGRYPASPVITVNRPYSRPCLHIEVARSPTYEFLGVRNGRTGCAASFALQSSYECASHVTSDASQMPCVAAYDWGGRNDSAQKGDRPRSLLSHALVENNPSSQ